MSSQPELSRQFSAVVKTDGDFQIKNDESLENRTKSTLKSSKSLKLTKSVPSKSISKVPVKSTVTDPKSDLFPSVAVRRKKSMLPVYTKSDSSVYPSYTNLILPSRVVCRQRYQQAINMHHEQFIKEIQLHERLQPYALGGVRLRREFCDPVLVKVSNKDIISMTIEEERRLEYVLNTNPKEL